MKEEFKSKYNLSGKTVIGDVIKKYPYIKEYMLMISPEYKKLLDPVQYMMMSMRCIYCTHIYQLLYLLFIYKFIIFFTFF